VSGKGIGPRDLVSTKEAKNHGGAVQTRIHMDKNPNMVAITCMNFAAKVACMHEANYRLHGGCSLAEGMADIAWPWRVQLHQPAGFVPPWLIWSTFAVDGAAVYALPPTQLPPSIIIIVAGYSF
jgi:hypothetical protein